MIDRGVNSYNASLWVHRNTWGRYMEFLHVQLEIRLEIWVIKINVISFMFIYK